MLPSGCMKLSAFLRRHCAESDAAELDDIRVRRAGQRSSVVLMCSRVTGITPNAIKLPHTIGSAVSCRCASLREKCVLKAKSWCGAWAYKIQK